MALWQKVENGLPVDTSASANSASKEKTKNNQYIFAILRRILAFLAISLWNRCLGVRFLYKLHTKKPLIVHQRVGILYFLLGYCHTFAVQFSTDLG